MSRPEQPATAARLRPVDLARLSGVSTQQIRNYEEAGVLPPVPRTASGYRVFGDAHRRALLTYRALSKGYGAVAATRIMRTVHEGDVPGALALVDAEHAALHAERVSLRATNEALRTLAGEPPEDDVPDTDLLIGEVAALLGVRTSTLRVWEAAGLLSPTASPAPATGTTRPKKYAMPASSSPSAATTTSSTTSAPSSKPSAAKAPPKPSTRRSPPATPP